jgi:hypothetical protein
MEKTSKNVNTSFPFQDFRAVHRRFRVMRQYTAEEIGARSRKGLI